MFEAIPYTEEEKFKRLSVIVIFVVLQSASTASTTILKKPNSHKGSACSSVRSSRAKSGTIDI